VQTWRDAVRIKGKWDYKQLGPQYAAFGKWHYGILAWKIHEELAGADQAVEIV
jgi:hypothetical protein